ncbi:Radial spoke head 10-like B [Oopsacas minuta]|uniref:Radial spoke head 10-like B n=1 Tax=Oopsacas minuta TaxID=111878 RepID=A0AAV7JK65_9METZ|nr:Radial spoke head 10-like B [Oopsacas minuta]
MSTYADIPEINTSFTLVPVIVILIISPVYAIYILFSDTYTDQYMSDSTIELSTSPSKKNFKERRAIQQFSDVPYKFKQFSADDTNLQSRYDRETTSKPLRPPPPPRPILKPSKSLGATGHHLRPSVSPKPILVPTKSSSPVQFKKSIPVSETSEIEDSFDNIDVVLPEYTSVPVTRPRAMAKNEQNTDCIPQDEDFSLGKAIKRFSDRTLIGTLFKRESTTSPNNSIRKSEQYSDNNIDSNPQDKHTTAFLQNAVVVVQQDNNGSKTPETINIVLSPEKQIQNTSELPKTINIFVGKTNTRIQKIHEMYTTEYTYVNQLEMLVDIFKRPMEAQLDEIEIQQIFCNVERILYFNREVLALFFERMEEWNDKDSCIGDIFTAKFTQYASGLYTVYCSSYDNCEHYITNKLKRRKEFEILMASCLSDPRGQKGMSITYYLITPVQRIPRYLLLLKDLLKLTPESHVDYQNILEANERISRIADYVNTQIMEAQSHRAMQALKNEIQGLVDLEKDGRVIIKEGPVFLMRIRKEYQCILFNDYLVLAYKADNRSLIEHKLPLEVVWIEDLQDLDPQTHSEDAIEIYTPDRPYTIYTKTNAEKKLWLHKLFSTIKLHVAKRKGIKDIPKNLEIDILTREAIFVYSNGDLYNGMFSDAKRHGHGEMVWADKTTYTGDWYEDERCGEGEMRYNTGEMFVGEWKNDKQEGTGRLDYVNGDSLKGNWNSGYREGDAVITFGNGDKFEGTFHRDEIKGEGRYISVTGMHFVGQYKHSQRCGRGTLCTTNGDYYDGEFKRNIFDGKGTMLYKDQSKYIGEWKNGQRNGDGEMKTAEGDEYEGSWLEDRKDGYGTMRYANNDYYKGMWLLDKRHGNGKMEFSNSDYYEGEFKHDYRHGKGLMKYRNGSKYDGFFEYNMRSGEGIMIFEDGKTYVGAWKHDMREGKGQLVSLHGLKYDGNWKNDKPHGHGNMKSSKLTFEYRGNWINGKREGTGIETGPKGKYNGTWKNGMRNGQGNETSLVGTSFEGHWTFDKKTGSVDRKLASGLKETQKWRDGLILNTKNCLIPPDLPSFPVFDF